LSRQIFIFKGKTGQMDRKKLNIKPYSDLKKEEL
jgi:hypothetical protein